MEGIKQEAGRGKEEAPDLRPFKIEKAEIPFLAGSLPIRLSRKVRQAEIIHREPGRIPVHDDADFRLMQLVYGLAEIVRHPIAGGEGEKPGGFLPGGIPVHVLQKGKEGGVGAAQLL